MTASNFILPRALIKALGPAPDGEDLKAIITSRRASKRLAQHKALDDLLAPLGGGVIAA